MKTILSLAVVAGLASGAFADIQDPALERLRANAQARSRSLKFFHRSD